MSEKTEEATPKKKRQAREEGNVAKSGEFTGALVATMAVAVVGLWTGELITRAMRLFQTAASYASKPHPDPSHAIPFLYAAGLELFYMIGPVLVVGFVAAAFFNYVQIGALFSPKVLVPQLNRLDPAGGFKKMFAPAKLVDLAKNVGKLSISGILGWIIVRDALPALLQMPRFGLWDAMVVLGDLALRLCAFLVGALLLFGVVDLIWQRHKHGKDLRMSKDEVKREYKESEGDPQIKSKRKQLHKQLLKDAGTRRVKDADAVVVNPTHVAVALRYRKSEMRAPMVLSAGRGEIAKEIRRLARRHNVPIVRDVDLARALVDQCDIDSAIPPDFFEPVAEILHHVYKLRQQLEQ